jgi:hypothetical protein
VSFMVAMTGRLQVKKVSGRHADENAQV